MWKLPWNCLKSLADWIYPRFCYACQASLEPDFKLLCESCLGELALLDARERCRGCFAVRNVEDSTYCSRCIADPPLIYRRAAAFPYHGPIRGLIHSLKYQGNYRLGRGLGAFMLAQWANLGWPKPDFVVPVPLSRPRLCRRGYNQSMALAVPLAEELSCPLELCLQRRYGDFSQAALKRRGRMSLSVDRFGVKTQSDLRGKVVLLIDDVSTTGATLTRCTEAILKHTPCFVYGMTLAQTEL